MRAPHRAIDYRCRTTLGRGTKKKVGGHRHQFGPIMRAYFLTGITRLEDGRFRDGIAYSRQELDEWIVGYAWCIDTEGFLMDIQTELKANYDSAAELWSKYEKQLDRFRSAVKNDVASLEASVRKISEAMQRMNKHVGEVVQRMNSTDMQLAITNAERLAAAVNALASVQSSKLTVAIVDNEKPFPHEVKNG